MQPNPRSGVPPQLFMAVAVVGSVLMAGAVLLWVADVLPFEAMMAVIVVTGVSEVLTVILLQRRASQRHSRAQQLSTQGGTSTLGPDGPDARYGYDPMGDLGPDGRR